MPATQPGGETVARRVDGGGRRATEPVLRPVRPRPRPWHQAARRDPRARHGAPRAATSSSTSRSGENADGFDDATQRIVSENANNLGATAPSSSEILSALGEATDDAH